MIEPLAVRVAKRLGKLPEQPQTRIGGQVGQLLAQETIEPDRVRIELEHQRRPKFRLAEVQHPQDTWMIDTFQHAELAHRHAAKPFTLIRRGGTRVRIDPNTARHSQACMFRQKILPAIALAK